MCEMLHADSAHQNYHQMGEWWENNTCKLVVRYEPFLIHQRALLPWLYSGLIISKLS
jgi:hypothetical protein